MSDERDQSIFYHCSRQFCRILAEISTTGLMKRYEVTDEALDSVLPFLRDPSISVTMVQKCPNRGSRPWVDPAELTKPVRDSLRSERQGLAHQIKVRFISQSRTRGAGRVLERTCDRALAYAAFPTRNDEHLFHAGNLSFGRQSSRHSRHRGRRVRHGQSLGFSQRANRAK